MSRVQKGRHMTTKDLTIEILESIRDEVRRTNARIDALREQANARFDDLARRLVESENRTTALIARIETERAFRALHAAREELELEVARLREGVPPLG